jgi:uncharacterized protein
VKKYLAADFIIKKENAVYRMNDDCLASKYAYLKKMLGSYDNMLVAFSGGADSTLLLKAAVEALSDKVLAVTIAGELHAPGEAVEAAEMAGSLGAEHLIVDSSDLGDPAFAGNPPDRCYHCKKNEYGKLLELAQCRGISTVADGANADDMDDYRPGMRAGQELGIISPLKDAGFTKMEIRALSRRLGLPTADKPANPCLASRFPYGMKITAEALKQVGAAEAIIRKMGIPVVRVRHHGNLARIEVPVEHFRLIAERAAEIGEKLKELGYTYTALDLRGYRMGSMNETLK